MRELSQNLLTQIYAQNSNIPFLELFHLYHPSFGDVYLANNTEDVISNGITYIAFPIQLTLPVDDGQAQRNFSIEFSNVGLDLIVQIRSVTTPISCDLKIVLADNPDYSEIEIGELKIKNLTYNEKVISASLIIDDFLNSGLSSERYTPSIYPGIFN